MPFVLATFNIEMDHLLTYLYLVTYLLNTSKRTFKVKEQSVS